jgi:hypothetical protein
MGILKALAPSGPTVTVKLRYEVGLAGSAGVANFCYSIGANVVALSEFANFSSIFGRFTISHAKCVVLPAGGFTVAAPTYKFPLALGYFNDQVAASVPGSYGAVLAD